MKKLLVLMMVLGIAGAANAALLISVDGVVDPPDSEIELVKSDWVTIDIWGDGQTAPGDFFMGLSIESDGPASMDVSNAVILYTGNQTGIVEGYDAYAPYIGPGVQLPFYQITMYDLVTPGDPQAPLEGTLIDGIRLHCDGPGEVTIVLTDIDGVVLDTQVIHQIPEPMTLGLLGLGGLFLRRRK
jgi:hypothetical protein